MNLATLSLLSMLSATPAASTEPLCVKREPCKLTETLDAGKDAQGQALQVKHLSLGWAAPAEEPSLSEHQAFSGGRVAQGSQGQCEANEWWLLHSGTAPRLLLATCFAAPNPLKLDKDEVKVSPNTFTRSIAGGDSSKRWTQSSKLQLDPLACMGESHRTFSSSAPSKATGVDWNPQRLEGVVLAPACEPAKDSYAQEDLKLPLMPQLFMDEAWLRDHWKQTGLGDCALGANFVFGRQDTPGDSSLKALLANADTLLIEVRDNHWTGPSKKWLVDDHVELWLGPEQPEKLNRCTPPTPQEKPVQWAIRIADGKVFPAYGSPKKPLAVEKVEIREAGTLVGYRLKVQLPISYGGISVLYSDSDSGKKPERGMSTSPLKFSRPETFNSVRPLPAAELTCQVRDGALMVVPTPMQLEGSASASRYCE